MDKSINIKVGFDSLKMSIIELSFSEKNQLMALLKEDLSKVELEGPRANHLLSENALKKSGIKMRRTKHGVICKLDQLVSHFKRK